MKKMFGKLFGKSSSQKTKEIFCEKSGKKSSLDNTVALIRINGIIISKNFLNPEIDLETKQIYSSNRPPIQFYRELLLPDELKMSFGRLFATVEDEDEIEMSTSILSPQEINLFTGRSVFPLAKYLSEADMVKIPDSMFFTIISKEEKLIVKECENWNIKYKGLRRKYMYKKVLDTRKEKQQFGIPGLLVPGYDVGISDVSQKHPKGHGYLFKTDNNYKPINLCSNESAVSFCKKNNVLIYYNDFLNKGKLRLLSEFTPQINKNLQNPYLYRSSNI